MKKVLNALSLNASDHSAKFKTAAGDNERISYKYIINATGQRQLIEDQRTDIQSEIDSYAAETDIKNIVKRAAYDPSVWSDFGLDRSPEDPVEIDITMAPGTLAEAQNQIITAKQTFKQLPKEIQAKFGYSDEAFIRSYGSMEWFAAMGLMPTNDGSTPMKYPGQDIVHQQEKEKGQVTE